MKFLRLAHPGKCTVTGLAIAVLMIAILISSLFIVDVHDFCQALVGGTAVFVVAVSIAAFGMICGWSYGLEAEVIQKDLRRFQGASSNILMKYL